MNESETRVAFLIADFTCDPDDITEAIGVVPTQVFRVGQPLGRGSRVVKSPVWRLTSPLDELDLEPHVRWLLERLPSHLEALRAWTPTWTSQLAAAADIVQTDRPCLSLSADVVARLAALEASFDLDTYCHR